MKITQCATISQLHKYKMKNFGMYSYVFSICLVKIVFELEICKFFKLDT
jgi:hypothetical protein